MIYKKHSIPYTNPVTVLISGGVVWAVSK